MEKRGDEMNSNSSYKTERSKIFTRLIELRSTSDTLLADNSADKTLRAVADDKEIK